jgi:hypothetical protein
MSAKGNKCCCCGECKGVVGCCACACKTLCFSIEKDYRIFGAEGDVVDGVFGVTIRFPGGSVSVSVTVEEDEYGQCYRIEKENGEEIRRLRIPQDVGCTLSGTIDSSEGPVDYSCTTKITPDCNTCECLCECICGTVYEYDTAGNLSTGLVNFGRMCWSEYEQHYEGTLPGTDPGDPEKHAILKILRNEYTGECYLKAIVDGEESSEMLATSSMCRKPSFQGGFDYLDNYSQIKSQFFFRCAVCEEECKPIPNCNCLDEISGEIIQLPSDLTVTFYSQYEKSIEPAGQFCTATSSWRIYWRGKTRRESNAYYSDAAVAYFGNNGSPVFYDFESIGDGCSFQVISSLWPCFADFGFVNGETADFNYDTFSCNPFYAKFIVGPNAPSETGNYTRFELTE